MSRLPDRSAAARMGHQAVAILGAGSYRAPSGRDVSIQAALAAAKAGTVDYPPGAPIPPPVTSGLATRTEVVNASTLAVAAGLSASGVPAALNFASAMNPGGGFLSGARAQEESLARSSGLVACIEGRPMYAHHRQQGDPLYTDWAMYSPSVPVFRLDGEALLEHPFPCAFITAAAPKAKAIPGGRGQEIREAFDRRIARVLGIAAGHGHRALILGAWGCGAFGNDATMVAERFQAALDGAFRGAFERVVFAVLDWSDDQRFIGPFRARFG